MNVSLIRQPSAILPFAISFLALAMVFGYVALYGVAQPAPHDERASARIFQMLMVVQLPTILYFAIKWLPRVPRQALVLLGLQCVAWMTPIAAILFFER